MKSLVYVLIGADSHAPLAVFDLLPLRPFPLPPDAKEVLAPAGPSSRFANREVVGQWTSFSKSSVYTLYAVEIERVRGSEVPPSKDLVWTPEEILRREG